MKLGKKVFVSVVICLGITLGLISKARAQLPPPVPVEVTKVEEQTLQRLVTLVGAVEPLKRSTIASEIAGLVEDFAVEEGDIVKMGDLLAKLRTDSLEIDLRQAKAQKIEAEARYRLAKKNLDGFNHIYTISGSVGFQHSPGFEGKSFKEN